MTAEYLLANVPAAISPVLARSPLVSVSEQGDIDPNHLRKTCCEQFYQTENNLQGGLVLPVENTLEQHRLQCLTNFFTDREQLSLEDSDGVISIQGNCFVVLPNKYKVGETLFRAVGQAVLEDEKKHRRVRDSVINYAISPEGWDALGFHIVSFYENLIEEMKHGQMYYGKKQEDFFQRAYKHYFVSEEMEGSIIELIGASLLYNFRYTCILQQYEDEKKLSPGKCCFRVIRSFNEETSDLAMKHHYYFIRVGESPSEWVWSLLVPYDLPGNDLTNLPRGTCIGELWNVYGLNWNKDALPRKTLPSTFFRWKTGISVISTTSGKLLGGYTTLGHDLFSNLCWMLFGNFQQYSTLRNTITSSKTVKHEGIRKIPGHEYSGTGTLNDLCKASKIYKFGFFVMAINEHGRLHNLYKSNYRPDKPVLHFLVRTRKGIIIKWCALQDMRFPETRPQCKFKKTSSPNKQHHLVKRLIQSGIKITFYYVSQLQTLIQRVAERNKVHVAQNRA